jgi:hypothetical protein
LRGIGALAAPVPCDLGGLGMGTEPDGAAALCDALRLLGRGNLAVGRIYEGHVNALRPISRFGTLRQRQRAAEDARVGRLSPTIQTPSVSRQPCSRHSKSPSRSF